MINLQNEGVFISNENCKSELEKVFINSGENVKHKIKEHLNEKILLLRTVDFFINSQKNKEILVNII
jgi:3-oxoacyl-[acyl-carrier-protein] synthase III